jgi:subtilisin family serine protease
MRRRDDSCTGRCPRGNSNISAAPSRCARAARGSLGDELRALALGLLAILLSPLLLASCGTRGEPEATELGRSQAALSAPVPQVNGTQPVWVFMKEQPSFPSARAVRDWAARGRMVHAGLTSMAARTQAPLRTWLSARRIEHKSFWIINAIKLSAEQSVIDEIARRTDVAKITVDPTVALIRPIPSTQRGVFQAVEWGLDNVGAPRVWDEFGVRGEGIVVANIDTGVEFQHPALVEQYRGNEGNGVFNHDYNWHDVIGDCVNTPCDTFAHGTHTMGTMVGEDADGQNQIGVAPKARWIASRPCDFECSMENFLESGQWVLAPTDRSGQNPRPDLRPHIVNNSWGFTGGDDFYLATVRAWVDAGIFPAFAAGNEGSSCSTLRSPGDYTESFTVGAHTIDNFIADFSSRGISTFDGSVKPDLTAPGVDVRSSVPGGGYELFSGTSMATPHLAGAVALMWSASPALAGDVEGTRGVLEQTAINMGDLSCGGTEEDNNVWGEGRLDAYEAVNQSPRGPTGFLVGTVRSEAGDPIANATIRVNGPIGTRTTRSSSEGAYQLRLPVDAYAVTVTAFGFITETEADVLITEDATTALDFALAQAPSFVVSGSVRDHLGAPLAGASVTVQGTPLAPAVTDEDGQYTFPSVPQGEYDLAASAGQCFATASRQVVVAADVVVDFELALRVDAAGYRCTPVAFDFVEATQPLTVTSFGAPVTVDLPFSFGHYGGVYDQLSIAGPGYVSFIPDTFVDTFNQPIPAPFAPNAAIFAFWDELWVEPGFAGSVWTETLGDAPNRRFVIEWRDVPVQFDMSQLVRFEIVLHETGEIGLAYHTAGPSSLQRGSSATVGLEDETGGVGFQYSLNQPVLDSGTALLFSSPPAGFVQGVVSDSNDGLGIPDADISVTQAGNVVRSTRTNESGEYRLRLPVGDYVVQASKLNYTTESASVSVTAGQFSELNFALDTGRLEATPGFLALTVPAGEQRTRNIVLENSGSAPVAFEVFEANGQRQDVVPSRTLQRNPNFDLRASNTLDLFTAAPEARSGDAFAEAGDVLRSFVPEGIFPTFVGFDGDVWLSTFACGNTRCGPVNVEFSVDGVATGRRHEVTFAGDVAGMSYDLGRDVMCQLAFDFNTGQTSIQCWNPDSGDVVRTITSDAEWTQSSPRGIAYRDDDDSFYVAGFAGTIYHVAGLSAANPGEVISSCRPADGQIADLAWNGSVGALWVSTNSALDTIYEVAPDDCTVLSTLAHPSPGFGGAGIDLDLHGNLWVVAQNTGAVFLIDSGVPLERDVPWLTVSPDSGTLAAGSSIPLRVDIDTSGLVPGVYLASLVVESNAGSTPRLRIPVSLVVPAYREALNTGGASYSDTLGELWAADRRYQSGSFGYVQRGATVSTNRSIGGTSDPALYRDQRVDPYAYRFDDVPNGVYEVELRFAELNPRVDFGERLFDVIVEDTLVLPAHDITYDVGRFAADDNRFFVEVVDGRMDVRFIARPESEPPVINALRVTHRPDR